MAKIIIHQNKITDKNALKELCPFNAIEEDSNGHLFINAACKMCRICCRKSNGAFVFQEEDVASAVDKSQWQGIAVVAELLDHDVHPVTLELLGKAAELAGKVQQKVYCLVMGKDLQATAQKIACYGPDEIHLYEADELEFFRIEPYTAALEDFIRQIKPSVVLVGGTAIGRSLAPRAAARFRTGLTADCTELDIQETTDLDQIRPAYGGNIMAHINTPNSRPQFATVRYKIFSAPEKTEPRSPIIRHTLPPQDLQSMIEFLALNRKSNEQGIEDAEVIIAAGRGIKKQEDLAMLEKLASLLGGQLAATRAVIEAGWLDAKRQIGLSGRTVKPKLIITCGVSGAVQFTAGMNGSELIVAINTDCNAPIFNIAHIGIAGDIYQIIPHLIARIEALQGDVK